MNTKTISSRALSIIDQYNHFKLGSAVCQVPYFNNKTVKARGALRTFIGKGSPQDIFEETENLLKKNNIAQELLNSESLKKILVDNNIGLDCSGLAYYVLNGESQELRHGTLDKHLSLINCHGLLGKIRGALRPVENCDVATFASDKNSKVVPLNQIQPGDMITIVNPDQSLRDHILVIHQVEYQNFASYEIHYSHIISYPEDGLYGSGIRQGVIEIAFPDRPITEALWTENGKTGESNSLLLRAKKSKTEVRRLKWF